MKKAWELAYDLFSNAEPTVLAEEEQGWTAIKAVSKFYDSILSLDWSSNVPGSGAPEKIMVAAIQALENRGYKVENGYELLEKGMKAHSENNFVELHKISAELKNELLNAKKDEESEYWKFKYYNDYEEYIKKVNFNEPVEVDVNSEKFKDQIKAAWMSQLIGAAMGTMVEGYTSKNLYKAFGDVKDYIRKPNTYNDDITFEIAFLDAFKEKGYEVTSKDIALSWIGLIPSGWSAEEIALRNIRGGLLPPESGEFNNPFNEWIGAQMRGAVCGMVAPGNPKLAAELAWKDGIVSHINNGVLGEVFNAIMISLAFVEKDVKEIVKTAINLIPIDSEYYSVVKFAYDVSMKYSDWHDALAECEKKYIKYNWIHSYPNACCEVIALMYGDGDYDKTLNIITMCGIDADCNAGMIMPILGIQKGMSVIPKRLISPAFNKLITYMRYYEEIKLDDLVDDTLIYIKKAKY
ncbi:ADP-ribosylglycohydrolase family protein [Sedimentibacter sp. MB31-C6]|uniref:ADP-ribosylglycohydrolase family protein n=1 Tax=Sedimentibacter sp. MB31-C6 TaxID=3109366 RepID=UPI002DDCEE3C|nr:ADP-ribosylglycohydrolase family protein [Sedimentibacter sp. MB36-C1]WSI03432.1 ADP-ribosylglycohydrolase family protein [Sedimentibacter sp. MB36-C1]